MLRAYKFRVYLTPEQQLLAAKTFGLCRLAYNLALAHAQDAYKATGKAGKILNYKQAFLIARPEAIEWCKEVSSLALAQEWNHLKAAFANFFRKLQKGACAFKTVNFVFPNLGWSPVSFRVL
jgi:putative transposase